MAKPLSANEVMRDAAIDRAANVHLYANRAVRQVQALLNRVDADLASQLAAALQALPEWQGASFATDRLDAQLGAVRELLHRSREELERLALREMLGLSANELEFQAALWGRLTGQLPALPQAATANVMPHQVFAATLARPFQGRLLSEWIATLEADKALRLRDAVRMGFAEGQSVSQIVRRVRGTRVRGYADGVLAIDRRRAEAVVRTALAHTAANAREHYAGVNADLLKGVQWVSTLDSRTTAACQVRDGKTYDLAHRPLGHTVPWLAGPGRLHWNCRSTSVPLLKSWRELGVDMNEIDTSTRASLDGGVPAEITYREWLGAQSAQRQDEILGAQRGRLLREGRLPVERLWDNQGHYLTLGQLAARHAQYFERL